MGESSTSTEVRSEEMLSDKLQYLQNRYLTCRSTKAIIDSPKAHVYASFSSQSPSEVLPPQLHGVSADSAAARWIHIESWRSPRHVANGEWIVKAHGLLLRLPTLWTDRYGTFERNCRLELGRDVWLDRFGVISSEASSAADVSDWSSRW
jgi:hypothetical protein